MNAPVVGGKPGSGVSAASIDAHARPYLAAIASLEGVGPARLRRLLEVGDPESVWARILDGTICAERTVSHGLGRRAQELTGRWRVAARSIDPDTLVDDHAVAGITMVLRGDPDYPAAFIDDPEPPIVLWAKGDLQARRARAVAIVGTRRCTRYGHDVARRFGAELSEAGVSVVSGLALGIDAAAHAGALDAPEGSAAPIAVVGTGLDVVYPSGNRSLWQAVGERGLLLSESAPGARAEPWRFPARNRLIAALVDLVVVVESGERGGSLYTVDEAVKRDVDVRAVPGPINAPASRGTNRLLADGAGPALGVGEILEELNWDPSVPIERGERVALAGDPDQVAVLNALTNGPATLSHLADECEIGIERLAIAMAALESVGAVGRVAGWYERRAR